MNKCILNEVFKTLDSDGSNYIEFNEFLIGIKKVYNINHDLFNDLIRDIFDFVDGYGLFNCRDQKLNRDELRKIWQKIPEEHQNTRESIAELLFNVVDTNNSGYLELSEFRRYLRKIEESKMKSHEISTLFAKLTTTEYDKITKEQFIKYVCES